ncbi:fasciclin domain-containing protein [uncultured Psychrobacter sp.]|uniref:fasciclin domain-containing protein n=1 Tax=uncultured Psychrobacter sp. TaxID=259303 RepID=UPI00345782FA
MLKKNLLPLTFAMAVLPLAACSNNETVQDEPVADIAETEVVEVVEPAPEVDPMADPVEADPMATQNITEVAAGNPDLSTLVAALQAAGLDQTLASDGQFTVFAPTNDAFAALLETLGVTQDELLADTDLLTTVLTYHVVPDATVMATDIPYGSDIETVNGDAFTISEDNVITASGGGTANITQPDVQATNGVIHVIDAVLVPE